MNQNSPGPTIAFAVALAAGVTAVVGFWAGWATSTTGVSLSICLGGIGIGLITWARGLPVDHEAVQERETLSGTATDSSEFGDTIELTISTVGRRPALRYLLGGALAALGAAIIAPLRFLGPAPDGGRKRTSWEAGRRVVSADGRPIAAAQGHLDQLVTVFPEGHTDADDSQVVLLRVPSDALSTATTNGGAYDGWVAYSKICTHAGCSVGLFGIDDRQPDVVRQLVCPCHQSVFDPTDGAKPIGGPAPRPLPQLPLSVDDEGFLIATADFDRPVGPAAWDD